MFTINIFDRFVHILISPDFKPETATVPKSVKREHYASAKCLDLCQAPQSDIF